jgi:hypothetical protein
MIRGFVFIAFCLMAAVAHAGECPKLKAGDSFSELSAILECQELRIKALELSRSVGGTSQAAVTASVPADGVWKPGKCFAYEKSQPFKVTITIEELPEMLSLCWKDGIEMAKVGKIERGGVYIFNPAGQYLQDIAKGNNSYGQCMFDRTCTLRNPDGTITFLAQALVVAGDRKHARLTIESRPH